MRVVVVGERPHDQHGAEDLVAVDLRALVDVGDQRRPVERARQVGRAAAGDDPAALARRARSTMAGDLRRGAPAVISGPRSVSGSCGSPTTILLISSPTPGDEVVVQVARDDRAGGRRAVLPGVDQRRGDGAVDGGVEVGVVEHHERRLAAEFQLGAVPVLRRRPPSPCGPTAVEPVNVTRSTSAMPGQRGADVVARAGDDVEHAVGQARLTGEPRQRQRGQRRDLGGLDDHRAAGGQRGQSPSTPPSAADSSTA